LRLVGTRCNRDCIGASVRTSYATDECLSLVKGGGSYLSAHDPRLVIAVAPESKSVRCDIQWPGGERSQVAELRPGGSYIIIQPRSSDHSPQFFEVSP
jgi:hypothetical protein